MTRRFNFLSAIALTLLFGTMAFAQQKSIFDDDVVKDPDGQHKEWRSGNTKYPSKPRDMWELGLHAGIFSISGDVNPWRPIPGYAFGLSLRKSLGYVFSVRLTGHYGVTRGVNFQASQAGAWQNKQLRSFNNGAISGYGSQVRFNPNPNATDEVFTVGEGVPWFANYENKYFEASIQGIFNLNNLQFHKEQNKWNLYVFGGGGGNIYTLNYDALDGDNGIYDTQFRQLQADITGANPKYDRDTPDGRREIRNQLIDNILDGDFETPGEVWGNLWNFAGPSDKDGATSVGKALANAGVGFGYRLSDRITLALEYQATFSDDDLLDGYRWHDSGTTPNADVDFTRDVDVPHYKNLRLNFHLGSFEKRVIPLWWLNPLDAPYEQIARNTRKESGCPPDDEDGDGVLDCIDKEPNTPADCPVDTRGVTLDSDSDGIPDCQDEEVYSPPGCPVDAKGVAQCPVEPPYTDSDVMKLAEENGWGNPPYVPPIEPCSNEWYLPMIHFDLDKYYLKPEFYPQLHHVANTMLRCPGIQVVVTGHTDARLPNQYNDVLSYKRAEKVVSYLTNNYGIDRSRLILQYGGEANPIVTSLGDNHTGKQEVEIGQYMNRRVEVRVARGESEAGRPAYDGNWDSVGKDTPRSSRSGNIYSGNPGAGY